MKHARLIIFFLLVILAGCSSVKFVARPLSPSDKVDQSDQSLQVVRTKVHLTARVQDTAVGGFDVDTAIGSFYLVLKNLSGNNLATALDDFTLVTGSGKQLKPLDPADVNLLLSPGSAPLFLPYPFVGYYSLIDLEQHRAAAEMSGERPFMDDGLSGVEVLSPFPVGSVASGDEVAGMIYFQVELSDESSVELRAVFQENRQFRFPFVLVK